MKVFITGASGYIGRHVTRILINKGYQVIALSRVRRPSDSENLSWISGSLESIDKLQDQLDQYDSIIHLAMDYKNDTENNLLDQSAVETFIASSAHLVYTGNLFNSSNPGEKVEERSYPDENSFRVRMENKVLNTKAGAAIIRPGFVYGGSGGFLWQMIPTQTDGKLHYIDNTSTHWPMIHVEDLAKLYLHIIENRLSGIFHGTDGEETKVIDVVNKIANIYQSPLLPVPLQQAKSVLGKVATIMNTDYTVANSSTFESGWRPEKVDFLIHAEQAHKDYLTCKH